MEPKEVLHNPVNHAIIHAIDLPFDKGTPITKQTNVHYWRSEFTAALPTTPTKQLVDRENPVSGQVAVLDLVDHSVSKIFGFSENRKAIVLVRWLSILPRQPTSSLLG